MNRCYDAGAVDLFLRGVFHKSSSSSSKNTLYEIPKEITCAGKNAGKGAGLLREFCLDLVVPDAQRETMQSKVLIEMQQVFIEGIAYRLISKLGEMDSVIRAYDTLAHPVATNVFQFESIAMADPEDVEYLITRFIDRQEELACLIETFEPLVDKVYELHSLYPHKYRSVRKTIETAYTAIWANVEDYLTNKFDRFGYFVAEVDETDYMDDHTRNDVPTWNIPE